MKNIEIVREENNNLKNKKGITLIALVITIIVLLILAGVAIATITGENGLLERATIAKEETDKATGEENDKISQYENVIDNYDTIQRSNTDGNYCTTPAGTTSTASVSSPCVIIENYRDGNNWYRVWSDGWIEQGGQSSGGGSAAGAKTTLLKPFTDTNYTVQTQIIYSSPSQSARASIVSTKNIDSFYVSSMYAGASTSSYAAYPISWYACGY